MLRMIRRFEVEMFEKLLCMRCPKVRKNQKPKFVNIGWVGINGKIDCSARTHVEEPSSLSCKQSLSFFSADFMALMPRMKLASYEASSSVARHVDVRAYFLSRDYYYSASINVCEQLILLSLFQGVDRNKGLVCE